MLAIVTLVRSLNGKSFSLLRTSIIYIKGSQPKKYNMSTEERMDTDVTDRAVDIN